MKKTSRLIFICMAYTGLIAIWFSFWLFTSERFWWMVALNRIVPYLFVPALILMVVTAVKRRPKLTLLCLLPFFIFAWLYWPYFTPRFVNDSAAADFRIMTFNVLYSNQNEQAVANAIMAHQPDLVALQEVQPEMMAALQTRLGEAYPYSLLGDEHDYGTTAVFSRTPFINQTILNLGADRPATVVTVSVNGQKITFAAVHLLAYGLRWHTIPEMPNVITERTQDQNRQAILLLEELEKQEGSIIIACDCNSKETSSSYRILSQNMTNAAREIGWQIRNREVGTRPDTRLQHIDYVFYSGALAPVDAYVIDDSGHSDHLPLIATFNLDGN